MKKADKMKKSKIFQHNSYTTLYGGFYEGTITAREVLTHGAYGIGTLDGADGEVIILNGHVYQGDSKNQVRLVSADETMPYAATVEHHASVHLEHQTLSQETLLSVLTEKILSPNVPHTVLISGQFSKIEISSKPPKNTAPYLEILAHQPHFTKTQIKGVIVGIWSPKHLESLYGNGFHLHFLSTDKTFGAHLVDFSAENVTVEFGEVGTMTQEFSENNTTFNTMKF